MPLLYDEQRTYFDLGPGGEILPQTRAKYGFGLTLLDGEWHDGDGVIVRLSGQCGMQPSTRSDVHVTFPLKNDRTAESLAFAESVLRLTIDHWSPEAAWLTASWFDRAVPHGTAASVGWQTYLTDPLAASVLPPGTQVGPFAGGILIRLDGPTFLRNGEQVAQERRISEALSTAGLLAWK
jgi:hypothetical protein